MKNAMKLKPVTSGSGLTMTSRFQVQRAAKGRLEIASGTKAATENVTGGRVPKVARLMALAIKFQRMLDEGTVKDYAELARLGHVSRARLTQIMNLTLLAPDIQEQILFLPAVTEGRDPLKEWQVRPVAAEAMWKDQQRLWPGVHTSVS